MTGKTRTRVGMYGDRWNAVAAYDHRIFPIEVNTGDDLLQRNHLPGRLAPDLHVLNLNDISGFAGGRTGNNRQEPCFLRVDSRADGARLPVEANYPPFEPGFQRLGDIHAADAIAKRLEFEEFRTNHFYRFAPVI